MLFTLLGDAYIADELVKEKTAVKLGAGDQVELKSTNQGAQILFVSSKKLEEPIVWGTRQSLRRPKTRHLLTNQNFILSPAIRCRFTFMSLLC
jgi:redox-sensitive bicupin YhaK (pirin superfamily)